MSDFSFPIVDLSGMSDFDRRQQIASDIRRCCENIGFFYVKNHGVSEEIVTEIFDCAKRYFEQPETDKLPDIIDEKYKRGFMPIGINQHEGFEVDQHESYDFMLDIAESNPAVTDGIPLIGPNRWPEDKPWLQLACDSYLNEVLQLSEKLLRIFALSLDLHEESFCKYTTLPLVHTRLLYYPAVADTRNNTYGVSPHTDFGLLTILAQDSTGGLEVLTRDNQWIEVPPIPGTFVVNLGDAFNTITSNLYVANEHRVRSNTRRSRISIPTFYNLDYDTRLGNVVAEREGHNPTLNQQNEFWFGEYLMEKYRTVLKY